eukprot:140545-Rhodomonas_salina.1
MSTPGPASLALALADYANGPFLIHLIILMHSVVVPPGKDELFSTRVPGTPPSGGPNTCPT